jgi:hypothetical protein
VLAEVLIFGWPALLYNVAPIGSQVHFQLAKEFLDGKKGTR